MTKSFYIKEKMWSLGGKFTIWDDVGLPAYTVEGSLFKFPKTFTIYDQDRRVVSQIDKRLWTFLPKFDVTLQNGTQFTISKVLTFFKSRYQIDNFDLDVQGDFWSMDFDILQQEKVIARISQEWLRLTSTYNIEVYDEAFSDLVISLVIAIDYVKELQNNNN